MGRISTKIEMEIRKVLINSEEELTAYQITSQVYKTKDSLIIISRHNYIRKVLEMLAKKGVIKKRKSYPIFYKFNFDIAENKKFKRTQKEVSCPNCNKLFWVDEFQQTKQCNCFKSNKKLRRFRISENRLTGRQRKI